MSLLLIMHRITQPKWNKQLLICAVYSISLPGARKDRDTSPSSFSKNSAPTRSAKGTPLSLAEVATQPAPEAANSGQQKSSTSSAGEIFSISNINELSVVYSVANILASLKGAKYWYFSEPI